jgi:hypothetical protein
MGFDWWSGCDGTHGADHHVVQPLRRLARGTLPGFFTEQLPSPVECLVATIMNNGLFRTPKDPPEQRIGMFSRTNSSAILPSQKPSGLSLGQTSQDWILPIPESHAAAQPLPPPPPGISLEIEMDQFCDVDDEGNDVPVHGDAPKNHDTTMAESAPGRPAEPRRWDSQPYAPVPFDELPPLPRVVPTPPTLQGFAAIQNDQHPMGSLGMAPPLPGFTFPNDDISIDAVGTSQQQPSKSATASVISWADSSYNASTASQPQDHTTTTSSSNASYFAHEGFASARHPLGDNPHKRRFSAAIERPATLQSPALEPISGSILIPDQNSKVSTCSGLTTQNDAPMFDATPRPTALPPAPSTAPKSELHRLYGKPPRRKVITSEYFHTWPDDQPSHVRKWTALFVCPITAELFFAGRYAPECSTTDRSLVWFAKKATAEHAAAARAFDCFQYRNRITPTDPVVEERAPIGLETPYFQPILELPPDLGIPSDVRQKIMVQQEEIRSMHGLPPLYR